MALGGRGGMVAVLGMARPRFRRPGRPDSFPRNAAEADRQMERLPTRLRHSGLVLLAPAVHGDERGFFMETFREDAWAEHGVPTAFVQDNHSRSRRGTLRGIHFQTHPGQGKLVRCARGRVLDVVVDLRRGSPTFGEWEAVELDDAHGRQLWIPVGFGHGFCVLSRDRRLRLQVHRLLRRGDRGGDPLRRPRRRHRVAGRRRAALLRARPRPRRGCPRSRTRCRSATREARRPLRPAARRATLHLGNLRTALLAWLFARSPGARFLVRMEDLDPGRVRAGVGERAARRPARDRARLGRRGASSSPRATTPTRRRSSGCARTGASTSASARAPRSARPRRRRTGRCPRAPTRAPACG